MSRLDEVFCAWETLMRHQAYAARRQEDGGRPESLNKRSYRSIRIPHAVYQRVANRLTMK